jgi:hypothetical protein
VTTSTSFTSTDGACSSLDYDRSSSSFGGSTRKCIEVDTNEPPLVSIPPNENVEGKSCIVIGGVCIHPPSTGLPGGPVLERPLGPGKKEFDRLFDKANAAAAILSRLRPCKFRHPNFFCKDEFNRNTRGTTSIHQTRLAECNSLFFENRRKACREQAEALLRDERKRNVDTYKKCLGLAQDLLDAGITQVPHDRGSSNFCGCLGLENFIEKNKGRTRR